MNKLASLQPVELKTTKFSSKINSLPNQKILDWSELKAFAEDKICVTQILNFFLRRVENIVGKEENVDYKHFLLFPHNDFKSLPSQGR